MSLYVLDTDHLSLYRYGHPEVSAQVEATPADQLAVTQAVHGTVSHTDTDVTYTPEAGFADSDSFTYTVGDGQGNTASATVDIAVEEKERGKRRVEAEEN